MNITHFRSVVCNDDTMTNITKNESSVALSLFGIGDSISIQFRTEQLPALEKLVDQLREIQAEEARQKLARLDREMQELRSAPVLSASTSALQSICIATPAEFWLIATADLEVFPTQTQNLNWSGDRKILSKSREILRALFPCKPVK